MTEEGNGSAGDGNRTATAARLGFAEGQVVQELGWDEDVDEALREEIEDAVGSPLEDEDYDGVVDAVLLWWRDGDGDLIDDCVDALAGLADKGFIALLVPRAGHPDHVDASDIQEAAQTAGLNASSSSKAGEEWIGTKLVQGGAAKQR
ncbi:DUF3052 family protein [Barrientosiimonas humi]|uniref:DUF3052 family protein n=2 Tax=Barrientosiimonas TaxID=1535207 RepID=A0A542XCD6_9MICO|nr:MULTISPECIES: DUF3052 domain-containing protein [Barrientosiimonas]TQL33498.1 DUF3052 family protein [Barrientosiimonas humi]BDZ58410.1 hypothetical protein GCM10025872_20670 [Barrientosiimonas endolithica]CAG7573486.1 hypothetical protein BH39T_PBIAJDOK_02120 [Barrientosiimonas humi]